MKHLLLGNEHYDQKAAAVGDNVRSIIESVQGDKFHAPVWDNMYIAAALLYIDFLTIASSRNSILDIERFIDIERACGVDLQTLTSTEFDTTEAATAHHLAHGKYQLWRILNSVNFEDSGSIKACAIYNAMTPINRDLDDWGVVAAEMIETNKALSDYPDEFRIAKHAVEWCYPLIRSLPGYAEINQNPKTEPKNPQWYTRVVNECGHVVRDLIYKQMREDEKDIFKLFNVGIADSSNVADKYDDTALSYAAVYIKYFVAAIVSWDKDKKWPSIRGDEAMASIVKGKTYSDMVFGFARGKSVLMEMNRDGKRKPVETFARYAINFAYPNLTNINGYVSEITSLDTIIKKLEKELYETSSYLGFKALQPTDLTAMLPLIRSFGDTGKQINTDTAPSKVSVNKVKGWLCDDAPEYIWYKGVRYFRESN